ncbi:MAG: hypothetical protein JXN64_07030 [Spirochaetes bacterium]|nr:hypothetical protein [Spirochaetota bacterium]
MNRRNFFYKGHLILWFVLTILTGILAGFLCSHSVMLGRYFTWLINSGNYSVFVDTFSVFRKATHANVHYNLFLWASLIIGFIWMVLCFILRKNRIVGIIAGLSSLWVGFVFFSSGFAKAEEAVCSGTADEALKNFFAAWNLPLHISFAVFYSICFFLLLLSGIRWSKNKSDV